MVTDDKRKSEYAQVYKMYHGTNTKGSAIHHQFLYVHNCMFQAVYEQDIGVTVNEKPVSC